MQITKRLQSKGAKLELAEEFAEIMKEREQVSIENLSTKEDIKNLENRLESKIKIFVLANTITIIVVNISTIGLFKLFG